MHGRHGHLWAVQLNKLSIMKMPIVVRCFIESLLTSVKDLKHIRVILQLTKNFCHLKFKNKKPSCFHINQKQRGVR